jgi:hypothetical protein
MLEVKFELRDEQVHPLALAQHSFLNFSIKRSNSLWYRIDPIY